MLLPLFPSPAPPRRAPQQPHFIQGLLREILKPSVPPCGSSLMLATDRAGWRLATRGDHALSEAWPRPELPCVDLNSLVAPETLLGKFARSPVCSSSEPPGLFFVPPWAGHRNAFGLHSGISGFEVAGSPGGHHKHSIPDGADLSLPALHGYLGPCSSLPPDPQLSVPWTGGASRCRLPRPAQQASPASVPGGC